jgi:hypothetical protein
LPISAEEMEAEAPKPKKVARKASDASADDGQGSLF